MIGIERCPCGDCTDYHLTGIGYFVPGSGFTQEDAIRIAGLLNRDAEVQQQPGTPLTDGEAELLRLATKSDGIELHESYWPRAEGLASKGYARLGPPRGPGRSFRRLEPLSGRREHDE